MNRDPNLETAAEFKARRRKLIASRCPLVPAILERLSRFPCCARRRYVVAGFLQAFRNAETREEFHKTAEFYGFQRACKHHAVMHCFGGAEVPLAALGRKRQ